MLFVVAKAVKQRETDKQLYEITKVFDEILRENFRVKSTPPMEIFLATYSESLIDCQLYCEV